MVVCTFGTAAFSGGLAGRGAAGGYASSVPQCAFSEHCLRTTSSCTGTIYPAYRPRGERAAALSCDPMLLCEIYLDIQLAGALERVGKTPRGNHSLVSSVKCCDAGQALPPVCGKSRVYCRTFVRAEKRAVGKEIGTILEQCAQWRAANLQIQHTAFGQAPSFGLTEKERSIARLAAEGHTNKESAAQMFL